MTEKVVPMIHVPDVRATTDWYRGIGFTVMNTYGNDGDGLSFAIVSRGSSQLMFNQGGQPSTQFRREVDLYVYTDNVDDLYQGLKDNVEIVKEPHNTFYGMREFIIRDLNGFWLTFGQSSTFEVLMNAVLEGNKDFVRLALDGQELSPQALTSALAVALEDHHQNPEIVEMLKNAGAEPPAEVDAETLHSYVGRYRGEGGFEINITFKQGKLFAVPGNQQPLSLLAVDEFTFRPTAFEDFGTLTFKVEGGKTIGCALNHGAHQTQLQRTAEAETVRS